jgi:hypothetical protein
MAVNFRQAASGLVAAGQHGPARSYLQPDGVIVFPGGHAGFAAGLSGGGGGGGLAEAATAGLAGGGGGGFIAAAAAGTGRGGGFGFTACDGGGVAASGLASIFDDFGRPVFCFTWSLAGSFLSSVLEPA